VTDTSDSDELFVAAGATFGLPDALTSDQAQRLAATLETGWRAAYGDLTVLDKDLQKTRRFFDPVAQGKRLREAIASLPSLDSFPSVPVELVIRVGGGRVLITPEGRCAIDLLRHDAKVTGDAVFLPVAAVRSYEAKLLRLYRDWGRHRLRQVIALLAGEDKPLQLPAAGVILVLLVNRSTSPDRAIRKRTDGARQPIDEAFFAAVYCFADAFGSSERRDRRKEGLVKGWTIGEVSRRLDELLVSDKDLLYLPEDYRGAAITRLASELARRRDVDEAHIAAGFDALVTEFRNRISVFASYGMAHERPRDTAQLRDALLAAFRVASQA
jgi:hypothetical protein